MSLGAPLPRPSFDGTPGEGTEPAFDDAIQTAIRERLQRDAGPAALLEGVDLDPVKLCRYAAQALNGNERVEAEKMLARNRWGLSRVAALVKGARTNARGNLARRLLDTARASSVVDPVKVAGASLLEEQGRDPAPLVAGSESSALSRLESEQPRVRAAALLALGRADLARPIFDLLSTADSSPLLELARRVACAEDEDRAWAELLSAV